MKPRLTNEGVAAQIRAMGGDGITFSKFKLGNGDAPQDYKEATDLSNVIAEVELTDFTEEEDTGYVQLTGLFNNSDIESAFLWREVGIYIQDPDDESADLLYAYGHVDLDETGTAPEIPAAETEVYEMQLTYRVFVGEADDISAIIADSAVYATKAQLEAHEEDQTNPHAVTAAQVGLGNVPNVSTDDQEPTISQAATLTNLAAGDKMSVIIGKIKKAIADLIGHIGNNTIHVSPTDRTNWDGKADGMHNHAATDIASGTLSITRGGTGAANAATARQNLGLMNLMAYVTGSFSGTTDGAVALLGSTFSVPSGYRVLAPSKIMVARSGSDSSVTLNGFQAYQAEGTGHVDVVVQASGSGKSVQIDYTISLIKDI